MTFFESEGAGSARRSVDDDPFTRLRREHRRKRALIAVSLSVAIVSALLSVVVVVVGPENVATQAQQLFLGAPPAPASDVVAVADRAFLTEEGRALLYASRAEVVGRDEIDDVCPGDDDGAATLGCYWGGGGLFVYQPADARIADAAVTTLAHELLHAAYDELGSGEVFGVHDLLYAEIARVPADDPVHEQIEGSVGGHESSRETELFAYLGSQVLSEGGFAPELEAVYARWISDRPALVDVYNRVESVMQSVVVEAQDAFDRVAADEAANATERAQLDADRAWHEDARTRYNADAEQYNALPEGERGRWMATWTTVDGATVSQPLGESLATRLAELEQYRVDLDARTSALAASEASVVARRAEAEARLVDVNALLEAAYPGQSFA